MRRLAELVPEKIFEPTGSVRITFFDCAKVIETRTIATKKEALELYNLWLDGKDLL
jgi:hypothetical protein